MNFPLIATYLAVQRLGITPRYSFSIVSAIVKSCLIGVFFELMLLYSLKLAETASADL